MSRRVVALVAAFIVVCALGACGEDEDREGAGAATGTAPAEETAQAPSGPVVDTVEISETDFKLDPQNPTVDNQGVVAFRISNEGQTAHNLEIETPQGEFELEKNLQPGESATLRVELGESGDYVMYCPVGNHREMGMEGKVTVGEGGGSGSGGGQTEDNSGGRGY